MIAVLAVGALSTMVLLVAGISYIVDQVKDNLDPVRMKKVSDSIVKIDEPLPVGFKRMVAIHLMTTSQLSFVNASEGVTIMFMRVHHNSKPPSAETILQKVGSRNSTFMDKALPAVLDQSKIQERGEMVVGGESMPYMVFNDVGKKIKLHQLVGVIIPKGTSDTITVIGQTMSADSYNMALTKKFLSAVKGF